MSHKQKRFTSDLERDLDSLHSINDEFVQCANTLRLLSYYEAEKTSFGLPPASLWTGIPRPWAIQKKIMR